MLEYDELEFQRMQNPRDHMVNIWGYSHISFMAPMSRFAAAGAGASAARREFKQLVRALHDAGIEVLLDLVYNHTVEGEPQPACVLLLRSNATPTQNIGACMHEFQAQYMRSV